MCPPDVAGAVGSDVFIGTPECLVFGIKDDGAVVTNAIGDIKESLARSNVSEANWPFFVRVPTHDRYSVSDDSIQVKPRLPCLSISL